MGHHIEEELAREEEARRDVLRELLWNHAATSFENVAGSKLRHMYKSLKKAEQTKKAEAANSEGPSSNPEGN